MFLSQTWSPKDDLPTVDVFLNILVAQLCVDIDQENHPERRDGYSINGGSGDIDRDS